MGNFKLNIEDFQSIGKANIEFVPGINLIVGQSNSGKTAILRALSSVLENPTCAKTFVKHKTDHAEVSFSYTGNDVTWRKGAKGSTVYGVNGEEYSKVGSTDLFDLLPDNGFVKSYNDEVMNIEGEWNLPFPFDRTPSELFRLFENVFCVSDSATILKAYKEEEADLVKQTTEAKNKIAVHKTKKQALDDLAKEVDLDKLKKELVKFETDASEYFIISNDYEIIQKSKVLDTFNIEEVVAPKEFSLQKVVDLTKDYNFINNVASKIKFYKTLPATKEVPTTINQYLTLVNDFELIEIGMKADNFNIDGKVEIKEDTLQNYFNLLSDLTDIENASKASSFAIEKTCKEDYSLTLHGYEELKNDLQTAVNCFRRCKAIKLQIEEINNRIKDIESQLSEYKVCPLCGHELEGEHALC